MKKNYTIKLKNGDSIRIDSEQFTKLSKALASKVTTPNFITIADQVISTNFIATIKADSW